MKKILTGLLFLLINFTCFSQTVKELEYELSYFKSDEEWGNKKNIAFYLLKIDSHNESAISGKALGIFLNTQPSHIIGFINDVTILILRVSS